MNQAECFVKLNIKSNVADKILSKVKQANESQWIDLLEQSIHVLELEDFRLDPAIYEAIPILNAESRISVLRFWPGVCYNWHADKIRYGAINMLLDGFDSFCAFGIPAPGNKFNKMHRLIHEPNSYYLMNVKIPHCVFNFSTGMRYLISIGIPNITYSKAVDYFKDKNLVEF